MSKNGGGSIVTVSSIQGLVGLSRNSPYVAAKDMIRSLFLKIFLMTVFIWLVMELILLLALK